MQRATQGNGPHFRGSLAVSRAGSGTAGRHAPGSTSGVMDASAPSAATSRAVESQPVSQPDAGLSGAQVAAYCVLSASASALCTSIVLLAAGRRSWRSRSLRRARLAELEARALNSERRAICWQKRSSEATRELDDTHRSVRSLLRDVAHSREQAARNAPNISDSADGSPGSDSLLHENIPASPYGSYYYHGGRFAPLLDPVLDAPARDVRAR